MVLNSPSENLRNLKKSKNNCFDNFLSVNKYIYSVKEKTNRAHTPYKNLTWVNWNL